MSSLVSPRVAGVLDRLFAEAERGDPLVWEKVKAEEAKRGGPIEEADISDLLGQAFMPVDRPSGRFLYNLVRTQGSRTVVEFGMSFGISTIHLAAAVRDNGPGRLITTEQDAGKVQRAASHLAEAGLLDVVEIRQGDALETLRDLEGPVDLVFLDGWKCCICRCSSSSSRSSARAPRSWPTTWSCSRSSWRPTSNTSATRRTDIPRSRSRSATTSSCRCGRRELVVAPGVIPS